jgi:4-hydroxyphenylacetate 3-monooxygenase
MTGSLDLRVVDQGREVTVRPRQCVIAGFTGADRRRVAEHIQELEREGVRAPETVPAFYELDAGLLVTGERIEVSGPHSSGEVEPVLVASAEGLFIGVGSDHTDRDLERADIRASKAACPKVLGGQVLSYPLVEGSWGQAALRSWASVPQGGRELYQEGSTGDLLHPERILELARAQLDLVEDGLVLFLGTVPLLRPGFRFATTFEGELDVPGAAPLGLRYRVLERRTP